MYSSALHSTPILAVSAATGSGQRRAHAPRSIAPVQHHDLKPFDKVFCDIAGPFPTTGAVNGYKYVIGFIDAKTSTSWVAPMHTQRDVQKWTERFLVWVRNQKVDGDVSLELVGF